MTEKAPKTQESGQKSVIGTWLTLMFLGLAAVPLIAALGGTLMEQGIRNPIESLGSTNSRIVTDYREVVSLSIALEAELDSAISDSFGMPESAAMQTHVGRLRQITQSADYLAGAGDADRIAESLAGRVAELTSTTATLQHLNATILERSTRIHDLADQIGKLTRGTGTNEASPAAGLAEGNILGSIRFWARTLAQHADSAAAARHAAAIDQAGTRYAAALRSTIFELSLLPENDIVEQLAENIDGLYALGRTSDGVFALARQRESAVSRIRSERDHVRADTRELLNIYDAVIQSNVDSTVLLLSDARRALDVSRLGLLGTAMISVLVSVWVLREYVLKRLVLRLRILTADTKRLSRGKLDTRVRIDGNDEITDIQQALQVFRSNAVDLRDREKTLEKQSQELQAVNAELEAFAYSASHDLRSPLQGIRTLAEFLIEDLEGTLPPESEDHLCKITSRVQRLEALLNGLLTYSRIGNDAETIQRVDFRRVVEDSAELLLPDGFTVSVTGEFPTASILEAPFAQVVRNLIDNAIKHHDRDVGTLKLTGRVETGNFYLDIADDGPGIDERFHGKIFNLFSTLRPRDDVEGSGLGLALVKKIVGNVGGDISLSSNPSERRGTTFTIRWPLSEQYAQRGDGKSALASNVAIDDDVAPVLFQAKPSVPAA